MDNDVRSAPENPKKRKWTENEETVLIQCVVEREGDLFGEIKGVGTKKKSVARREGWGEISGILNSQFSTTKRDVEEVKKKYFNLKQRAKEKIDNIKRSVVKTGGGPAPPSLTPGEEAIVKTLEGRPVACGIKEGIDTDAIMDPVGDEFIPNETNCSSSTVSKTTVQSDLPCETSASKETSCTSSKVPKITEKRKSKRSLTDLEQLTLQNIKLDNERLELELVKLKKETEKISEELSFLQVKKLYYQLKIQSEFQISLVES